jgi:hypothetical protein
MRRLQLLGMLARLQLLGCDLELIGCRLHVLGWGYLLWRCLQGWLRIHHSLLLWWSVKFVSHLLRTIVAS